MLNRAAEHYHVGVQIVADSEVIDTRAEVAILNRNVRIRATEDEWNCSVTVADFLDFATTSGDPVQRSGKVQLDNVEITECGQPSVKHSSLRFENNGIDRSVVTNSILQLSDTFGLYIENGGNVLF